MIVSLSFLYHILIKIWAPRASWEINEHSYCYWNQHKGILCSACPYLNNSSHGHHPLFHQPSESNAFFLFNLFSPAAVDANGKQPLLLHRQACVLKHNSKMWKCAGRRRRRWRRQACTWMHSVTFYLPRGCARLSYLRLCKAGVKHKALVNDQPRAYDCITLQWICSRWVEYYWWISFFPTKFLQSPMTAKQWTGRAQIQPVK